MIGKNPGMDDLQRSELVISKVVTLVASWGIQEKQLNFEELELPDDLIPFFVPCIEWLEAEGVLRTKKIIPYMDGSAIIVRPVITSLGMKLMGSTIALGDETEKLATAAAKVSTGEKSYSQIGDFFGGLLGGFTKSLSS